MSTTTQQLAELLAHIPANIVGPLIGAVLLVGARRYLGGWPDLWRTRRILLPLLHRLGGENAPHAFTAADDAIKHVDVSDLVPEKTQLPLQDREFVGVVDAPPATMRQYFREQDQWWPAVFASIQYDLDDNGDPVYEVGSYAQRRGGFLGSWQTHVRLTPRNGGSQTALWAHYERSPIAHPRKHYNSVGWQARPGVGNVASAIQASEFTITLSETAQNTLQP